MEPTKEQYLEALQKADAAGNVEDAKKLAQTIAEKFGNELETEAPDTPSAGEAFLEGAAEGLSGGFSAELQAASDLPIMAATAHTAREMQGNVDTLSTIKEMYNSQLQREEENLEKFKKQYPKSYMAGDIAGSILGLATGGSALRAAKYGAKALSTASGFLTSMGLFGGIHGAGRSNSETIEGRLKAGMEGAVIGAASEAVMPGVGRIAKSKVIDPLKEKLRGVSGENFLKFLGGDALKTGKKLNEVGKNVTDWSERIVNYTDESGEPLVKLSSSLEDLDIVFETERKKAGKSMGSVLGDIDTGKEGVSVHMDPEVLFNKLRRNHVAPLLDEGLSSEMEKKAGAKLEKELKETFLSNLETQTDVDKLGNPIAKTKIVNKNLNLIKLHKMSSDIHKEHRALSRNVSKPGQLTYLTARKKMASEITESIDDMIEMSGNAIDKNLIGQYRASRERFGDLLEAEKVIENTLNKDTAANFVTNLFRDTIFRWGSAGSILGEVANQPYLRETALAVAGLRALQSTAISRKSTALGLQPIIKALSMNPEKYSSLATRLIQASATSSEAFIDQVMQASAEVDLLENPVERSSNEVIRRKETILTRLQEVSPEAAKELRTAIDNNDTASIRGIMASVAETSKGKTIEKGIGWDGYAVTDAEINQVRAWIKSVNSVRKQRDLTLSFESNKRIPEEMLQGGDGKVPAKQFIYNKAKDKVRNPEY